MENFLLAPFGMLCLIVAGLLFWSSLDWNTPLPPDATYNTFGESNADFPGPDCDRCGGLVSRCDCDYDDIL